MRKKFLTMVISLLMSVTMVATACGTPTNSSSRAKNSRQPLSSNAQPSAIDSSSEEVSAVEPSQVSSDSSFSESFADNSSSIAPPSSSYESIYESIADSSSSISTTSSSESFDSSYENSSSSFTTIESESSSISSATSSSTQSITSVSSSSSSSSSVSSSLEILNPTPVPGTSSTVNPTVQSSANTSANPVTPSAKPNTSTSTTPSSSSSVWLPDIYDYDNVKPNYGNYDDSVKYNYSGVTYATKQGGFSKSGNTYTTTAGNSIAVNTSVPFPYGSFSADVTYKGGDSGLIFGYKNTGTATWEGSGISFYFLFINDGNFHLARSVNGTWTPLYNFCTGTNDVNHTYNIRVVMISNKIICMLDNLVAFTYVDASHIKSTGFGIRAGVSGTVFSNIEVTNDYDFESDHYKLDNGYNYSYASTFTTLQGTFTSSGANHTATADNSIMVNTTPFRYGSIQVDLKAANTGDNGIVFGYTNYGSATWEGTNLSYYFLFVNYQGIVILGKTNNNSWSTVAQSGVVVKDFNVSHKLLLVYKEREINVYLDNVKMFTVTDPDPLFGSGYGIRAGKSGANFSNFTITSDYLK